MSTTPGEPTLSRILAAGPALALGEWALDRAALGVVVELAERPGCDHIVECGSGTSTVALARLLRARGSGRLWALEHDGEWAANTSQRLTDEGLDERAVVIEAPLEPGAPGAAPCGWYSLGALDALPSRIDLLLVDGPPAPPGDPQRERSRLPALPVLADRLAPGAAIVLDDAHREGERWARERWQNDLGVTFRDAPGGTAVGEMRSTAR